jgi:hypothetical protein
MNCLVSLLPNSDALDLAALGREGGRKTARPRKLDPAKGEAFIKQYEDLLHRLADDETVIFADAAHPLMQRFPPCAGRRRDKSSLADKPAGAIVATFAARSISS